MCVTSDDPASRHESTVDRIAEMSAPANGTYSQVPRCRLASSGTSCSASSRPGARYGPHKPRMAGISPTDRYSPPPTKHARRAVSAERHASTREISSTASIDPTTGTIHASSSSYHGTVPSPKSARRSTGTSRHAVWISPLTSSTPARTMSPTTIASPCTRSVHASANRPPMVV